MLNFKCKSVSINKQINKQINKKQINKKNIKHSEIKHSKNQKPKSAALHKQANLIAKRSNI